ncbi:MAG: AAA family ATPase, partial [Ktedonobacteraceae bacterium]
MKSIDSVSGNGNEMYKLDQQGGERMSEQNEETVHAIDIAEPVRVDDIASFRAREAGEYEADQQRRKELDCVRSKTLVSAEYLIRREQSKHRFLIGPDLLPKCGRMLITGKSGTGKSMLTLHLAACLASKQAIFGITNTHRDEHYGQPRFPVSDVSAVLYIDYELPQEIRAEKRLRPLAATFPSDLFQQNLFFP